MNITLTTRTEQSFYFLHGIEKEVEDLNSYIGDIVKEFDLDKDIESLMELANALNEVSNESLKFLNLRVLNKEFFNSKRIARYLKSGIPDIVDFYKNRLDDKEIEEVILKKLIRIEWELNPTLTVSEIRKLIKIHSLLV